MTRACKDVLDHLRKLSTDDFRTLTFVSDGPYICACDNTNDFYDYTDHKGEISAIIRELARTGYLTHDDLCIQMCLTYKGLHPYAMTWVNLKPKLIWSILVPIGISIATSLLTVYITALLSSL